MLFFFFKQKTAYEIYQCDWSSDVCSSDLAKASAARYADWRQAMRAGAEAPEIASMPTFTAQYAQDAGKTIQLLTGGDQDAPFRVTRHTDRGAFLEVGFAARYIVAPWREHNPPEPFSLPAWLL